MFPARFNGPPGSANGGCACGVIAQHVPSDLVEVTLRRPPPLDTTLFIERTAAQYSVQLNSGDIIAVAEPVGEPITADPVVVDIPAEAPSAFPDGRHPFRTCFTCGPDRAPGDGLRIFAKRIRGQAVLADRWTPDQSLADNDGSVRPEIVWASLDCPGGWAAFDRIPGGVAGSRPNDGPSGSDPLRRRAVRHRRIVAQARRPQDRRAFRALQLRR